MWSQGLPPGLAAERMHVVIMLISLMMMMRILEITCMIMMMMMMMMMMMIMITTMTGMVMHTPGRRLTPPTLSLTVPSSSQSIRP
jgi:hypothetical protein